MMGKDCKDSKCVGSSDCTSPLECEVNKGGTPVSRFSDDETFSPRIVRKG